MQVASQAGGSRSAGDADAMLAKQVVRKIDRRLIPLLFVTYALSFMDKTILSSASVFGLKDDTHLRGQDYSWVSAVFYLGYLAWTYPTTVLVARLPVARYMAANTLFWGAAVGATAACSSYGGLLTARLLLGVAEATVTPALMFITTAWYTRDEMPLRTGIWFSGNAVGGMVASLFAFGVGHIGGGTVGPWRCMFIILGAATFLWGLALWLALPDAISTAGFLTGDERRAATRRVMVAGTGRTEGASWDWAQLRECLADPKTWFVVCLELLTQVPNGGTQSFANLVITSFGFTALQSTLLNMPYSLLSGGCIVLTAWLAGRLRRATCALVALAVLPCVAGSALIYSRARVPRAAQLLGYFLLSAGPSAMPLVLSLVQANYRGVTKKATVTALLFLAYCAGNIAGPQLFRAAEAPAYTTAFGAIMVCYSLVVVLALGLRAYLARANAARARLDGFQGSAGSAGAVGGGKVVDIAADAGAAAGVELRSEDYEDVTDWQKPGFRYRL